MRILVSTQSMSNIVYLLQERSERRLPVHDPAYSKFNKRAHLIIGEARKGTRTDAQLF